jgi:hypothetical protein
MICCRRLSAVFRLHRHQNKRRLLNDQRVVQRCREDEILPLGNWLFIGALALVLFQLLSRIETRAADHALVQLVLGFYFAFHWILL